MINLSIYLPIDGSNLLTTYRVTPVAYFRITTYVSQVTQTPVTLRPSVQADRRSLSLIVQTLRLAVLRYSVRYRYPFKHLRYAMASTP